MAAIALLFYLQYRAIMGWFYPAEIVEWLAYPPALAGGLGFGVGGGRLAFRRGKRELQRWWVRWLGFYLLGSAFATFALQLSLAKGAAGVLNGWFGTPTAGIVAVTNKLHHVGRSPCRYALYLAELSGYPLCVSANSFAATAVGDRLDVALRSSWLGVSIEGIRPAPSFHLPRPTAPP